MLIEVLRYHTSPLGTSGILLLDGKFQCYTCEDPWKANKEAATTRIHPGTYEIRLRADGGMNVKYAERYDFHAGMLHLQDTPEFEWVYIHTGNKPEHSQGCILVGTLQTENHHVANSRVAYTDLYKKVSAAALDEDLWISIRDYA
jgi:hypothetical protein